MFESSLTSVTRRWHWQESLSALSAHESSSVLRWRFEQCQLAEPPELRLWVIGSIGGCELVEGWLSSSVATYLPEGAGTPAFPEDSPAVLTQHLGETA